MQVVLVRVGIDAGSGGMQGPLFRNGTFEFVPIPDKLPLKKKPRGEKPIPTYGNTAGAYGRKLMDCFPEPRQEKQKDQPIHQDPEFETFTYGDPTTLKSGLKKLEPGDLLVFYAGLEGWGNFRSDPRLYIIGYFEVQTAGKVSAFTSREIQAVFGENAHVCDQRRFRKDKPALVLVKGTKKSRLLKQAVLISEVGEDCNGKPLKILSEKMQKVFGKFDGHLSFQRSPPRWVDSTFVDQAAKFVRRLR